MFKKNITLYAHDGDQVKKQSMSVICHNKRNIMSAMLNKNWATFRSFTHSVLLKLSLTLADFEEFLSFKLKKSPENRFSMASVAMNDLLSIRK